MESSKRLGSLIFPISSLSYNNAPRRDIQSPIIIQVSQGGAAYFAGKGLANDKQQASIAGAVAAAHHIRIVSKAYGVWVLRQFLYSFYIHVFIAACFRQPRCPSQRSLR